ncbi:unnamed protein product, partial [marine sediment metagenome]
SSDYLVYCGKVGTGFNNSEVKRIFGMLQEAEVDTGLVTAKDSKGKAIRFTPVDLPLEVTVKFQETTKYGVFRIPSMVKENGVNQIHYDSNTIKAKPGQTDLKTLLEGLSRK